MDWFGDDEYFNHKIKLPNQSLPTKTIGDDVLHTNIVVYTVLRGTYLTRSRNKKEIID